MKKRLFLVACFMVLVGLVSTPVYAHYLWLTVDNYNPSPGQEIAINIGWGHKFPRDGQPRAKMVRKMTLFLVNPQGKKIPLTIKAKGEKGVEPIRVKLKTKGTYLAVLAVGTFVTKTIEGYFYKPKNELKNVLESFWYEPVAKAIINVGAPGGNIYKKRLGYPFEIVPLENPVNIKEGGMLPVSCVLNGKPSKAWIYATYAGFSKLRNTFAWTTRTDKKGIARVKILKKGLWLVKTDDSLPYKDPGKADSYKFISTLTFKNK